MKLREDEVRLPAPAGDIRTIVIGPVGEAAFGPGVLLYTDIFQLTESTLRTARRLASYGFVVVVPEIYPHGELAGVALEFDDAGKAAGQAGAAATAVADFDADRVAVLDWMEQRDDVDDMFVTGFCIGGHLAFRAAFDRRVAATVCFYPTGLHNGALGADADAGSLARAGDVQRPDDDRLRVAGPARAGTGEAPGALGPVRGRPRGRGAPRLRGRGARLHAGRRSQARPGADRPRPDRGRLVLPGAQHQLRGVPPMSPGSSRRPRSMTTGKIDPRYGDASATAPPWAAVERLLTDAQLYWIITVRADGRPHAVPLVGVWQDGAFAFCTGAEEQKQRNLDGNAARRRDDGQYRRERLGQRQGRGGRGHGGACDGSETLQRLAAAWFAKYGDDWTYEVRGEKFVELSSSGGSAAGGAVYRVAPAKAIAFGGTHGQTTYRF